MSIPLPNGWWFADGTDDAALYTILWPPGVVTTALLFASRSISTVNSSPPAMPPGG